jgi:hypothetical protein
MSELDVRAKREWENNCCEGCFQPLRDCLCDEQVGCGACGEMISVEDQDENGFHDPEFCGANDEIKEETKWANLPTTCADFVAHPHLVETTSTWKDKDGNAIEETKMRGCYTCQMALASEEQGTTALASALLDLDICCEVVQTGGFTMCVYIKTGEESFIYANDEGFSFYCGEDCEGLQEFDYREQMTPKEKASEIAEKMKSHNLEAKEL